MKCINPIRQTRDKSKSATPLMTRQKRKIPANAHKNSTPQTQNPATLPATNPAVFKTAPMLNGEVLVDSCFLSIFSIVLITPDFFLCRNGAGMVSSVSEAVERQGLAHSKICAKKTAGA